ncbi:MAG: hypothetical protein Q8Q92_01720 [bacterium]|nr:hypothetical protein [bacterium]
MLIETATSSGGDQVSMEGFPLLPKRLPTKESYEHGEVFIYKWWWLCFVRWVRLPKFDRSKKKMVMADAHWAD